MCVVCVLCVYISKIFVTGYKLNTNPNLQKPQFHVSVVTCEGLLLGHA